MKTLNQFIKVQLTLLVLMLCSSMTVFAVSESVEIDGKYYELYYGWSYSWEDANNNWHQTPWYQYAAFVTSSTGNGGDYSGDIQINETVNYNGIDYTVVGVGWNAFSNCPLLTSVELPSTVVRIDGNAFYNCNSLTSISMPGVMSIGPDAFSRCALTSLQLPKSLQIEEIAFRGNSMASITIDPENENFTSVDGVLYDKNVTKIVGFPNRKGGVYIIPSTVTTIKANTFSSTTTLDELVIPASVTKIESYAFDYNANINKLTIADGTTELVIGQGSYIVSNYTDEYGNWYSINTVLTQLREIYWGRNIKLGQNSTLFGGSYNLNKIVFGENVTTIPKYSFRECYHINEIDVKGGIKQWCNFDFTQENTDPFGFWMAPADAIGSAPIVLFNGAPLEGAIELPSGITKIPSHGFQYGCSGITDLTLNADLEEIADGAFRGLSKLKTIQLVGNSNYFKVIENVLYNYDISKILCFPQLRAGEYVMPSTITELGKYTFYNCCELTGVTFSANLQAIPEYAFGGCTKLTTLTIPSNIATIYDYAFDGCTAIKNLVIEDAATTLSLGKGTRDSHRYSLFAPCPISEAYIGRNLELKDFDGNGYYRDEIWNGNSYNYTYHKSPFTSALTDVTIGNKVNRLPSGLFENCWSITSVHFAGTITEWCNITFEDVNATPFGKQMSNASPILYLNGQPLHSQVNIPSGATKIGAYAFYGQNGVSNITLPVTIQTIEPYAFSGANDVYINATNVITLENINSFSGYVYVPDAVIKTYRTADVWSEMADRIYPLGFLEVTVDLIAMSSSPALLPALNALEKVNDEYRITALTNLKIRGTMNGWDILMIRNKMPNLRRLDLSEATILDNDGGYEYYQGCHTTANTISERCFYNLDNLRTVVLPQNITSIDRYAFNDCNNLEEVLYIPETCTSIGKEAFSKSGLMRIEIGEGVDNIGTGAFKNCSRLNSVVIPTNSVKRIESNAFYYCGNLTNLSIGKGLEYIGSSAFDNCGLRSLVLPTSLKRIESRAFSYCYSLQNVNFAEGLTEIGEYAFQNCSSLRNLRLPTSLRTIGNSAFRYCSSLSEVHVPSMLQSIGDEAFKGCGLNAVYAYTVVPVPINQNTFDYTGVDLYAPDNSFYAYYLNTQWSQFQDVKEFEALYTSWYTPRNKDAEINVTNPIKNLYDDNAADGIMEPGSGLIIVGDGEQLVKGLILNWEHGSNYPALIENNNLSVEELKFIMNVYPGRWYFFSFPFDIKISDTTFDGKYVWRYYDAETRAKNGSGGWKNVTDGWLRANVGYIFQANTAGELELPVNNPVFSQSNDQKEVPLESIEAKNPQDASWNFVGNPNLSYYSLDDMAETFDAPITVWNQEQQTYTAVIPGDDDYNFHPFEAYFVQTPADVDKMTFENENRTTYSQSEKKSNQARRMTRSGQSVNEKRMLINLTVSDGQTTDKTRVIFNDDNKMTYETGRDANKFMSMANVPQIYTIDAQNVKYSINARPNDNRQVRLGFVASSDGNYTIAAERMDCSMALKDNQTGTIHQLDGKPYTFYSEAGTFDNRFTLMSGANITSVSANGLDGIDGFNVAAMDGGIIVTGACEGNVNVYNANGVKAATLKGSGTINLNNGTYIVTYAGKSAKIAIK